MFLFLNQAEPIELKAELAIEIYDIEAKKALSRSGNRRVLPYILQVSCMKKSVLFH